MPAIWTNRCHMPHHVKSRQPNVTLFYTDSFPRHRAYIKASSSTLVTILSNVLAKWKYIPYNTLRASQTIVTLMSGMLNSVEAEIKPFPDKKVHGANMGPTWVLSAPDGPHFGPMNLVIGISSSNAKLLYVVHNSVASIDIVCEISYMVYCNCFIVQPWIPSYFWNIFVYSIYRLLAITNLYVSNCRNISHSSRGWYMINYLSPV